MRMYKEHQMKLAKIFVLCDLLIQEIDDPAKIPTKDSKMIQDKSRELQGLLEPMLERFYNNKEIQKTTFFIELQNKFNYNFKKAYKL